MTRWLQIHTESCWTIITICIDFFQVAVKALIQVSSLYSCCNEGGGASASFYGIILSPSHFGRLLSPQSHFRQWTRILQMVIFFKKLELLSIFLLLFLPSSRWGWAMYFPPLSTHILPFSLLLPHDPSYKPMVPCKFSYREQAAFCPLAPFKASKRYVCCRPFLQFPSRFAIYLPIFLIVSKANTAINFISLCHNHFKDSYFVWAMFRKQ